MAQSTSNEDRIIKELQDIKTLLQNLLIIQGAMVGMKKADVRNMVGIASSRVTSIWKEMSISLQS